MTRADVTRRFAAVVIDGGVVAALLVGAATFGEGARQSREHAPFE